MTLDVPEASPVMAVQFGTHLQVSVVSIVRSLILPQCLDTDSQLDMNSTGLNRVAVCTLLTMEPPLGKKKNPCFQSLDWGGWGGCSCADNTRGRGEKKKETANLSTLILLAS